MLTAITYASVLTTGLALALLAVRLELWIDDRKHRAETGRILETAIDMIERGQDPRPLVQDWMTSHGHHPY